MGAHRDYSPDAVYPQDTASESQAVAAPPATTCTALVVVPKDTLAELTLTRKRANKVLEEAQQAATDSIGPGLSLSMLGGLFGGVATAIAAVTAPVAVPIVIGTATLAAIAGGVRIMVSAHKRENKAQIEANIAANKMLTEQLRIKDETQKRVADRTAKLQACIGAALGTLFPDGDAQVGAHASFEDPDRPGHDLHMRLTRLEEQEDVASIKRVLTVRIYEARIAGYETSIHELEVVSPMQIRMDKPLAAIARQATGSILKPTPSTPREI